MNVEYKGEVLGREQIEGRSENGKEKKGIEGMKKNIEENGMRKGIEIKGRKMEKE